MKCVLILGAAGFIGQHLCSTLAKSGVEVIAATRQPVKFGASNVSNAVVRFDEQEHFAALVARCDTVIHAASSSTPGSSEARPQLDGNLRPTLALIETLQAFPNRRLLYLSSGGTLYGDLGHAAREYDTLRPRSYHGAGKAAAEQFIHAWAAQYNGKAVVLRPSNVYGPGQPRRPDFGIIPAALDCAQRQRAITIWGDGTTVRDYLYIDDLVSLCVLALQADLAPGISIFNASSGRCTTLNSLLDEVDRVTGQPLQRNYHSPRRVDIHSTVPDPSMAKEQLSWTPGITLPEGLRRTWASFSKHG